MLPLENLLAAVNRESVPTGQAGVTARASAGLLCSHGQRMKRVYLPDRQTKRASMSGRRKKGASTSPGKTGEFMLSPEQLTDNAEEALTAKTGYAAGEKGVLHRGTVNETML